jgi:NAD-reducing hydrogenase large subunit
MDNAVNNVAKKLIKGTEISEALLNQVEMAIRCYDPCLSCSTHKLGQMPLEIQIVGADGTLMRRSQRGE